MSAAKPQRRERAAWLVLLVLALGFGVWLRWNQLGSQIPLDDEWHALNKLLRSDAADIATHFGLADYSIPLTLYFRFLYLHGGLGEWGMRLPMLLAGIGLLLAGPWLARSLLPRSTRALWVGLMAISPMMVYHSRTARPYAITTLLCVIAIFAFYFWWRGGERRWRWAALYAFSAFLSGWLHLITLAFALAPFLYYGAHAAVQAMSPANRITGLRQLRDLVLLGLLTGLLLATALLPPLFTDLSSLAAKAGTDSVTLHSGYRTLLICFGVASPWLLAAIAAVAVVGVLNLWKREREFTGYVIFVLLVAVAAIVASKAAWLQHPLNFARYIQPMVPFLLLATAEGVGVLLAHVPLAAVRLGLGAAMLVGLYLAGPIPSYLYDPNQFMEDAYFQFDYDPRYNPYLTMLPHGPIPAFYQELGKRPARSITLIETPWSLETNSDPQPLYQAVHHQRIRIALTTPECGISDYGNYPETATGMRLKNFVHLSALLRGETYGADFLVVHLRSWPEPAQPPSQWPDIAATCLPRIEQHFGAPVYRDDDIEVFALGGG